LRGPVEPAQYTAVLFGKRCAKAGIEVSMGSVGDCYDNAVCETFHATLKKELVHRRCWPEREELRREVFDYIEIFWRSGRFGGEINGRDPEFAWTWAGFWAVTTRWELRNSRARISTGSTMAMAESTTGIEGGIRRRTGLSPPLPDASDRREMPLAGEPFTPKSTGDPIFYNATRRHSILGMLSPARY